MSNPDPQHQHRVVKRFPDGTSSEADDITPEVAGESFRKLAKSRLPGENVEIQKREVGPWKVVRTTAPEKEPAS